MSGEKNDYRFKLLYAIGMIIVVAGHCGGDGGFSLMYEFFTPYSFHLALFVFCSGYFYKDTSERTVGKYVLKKVKMYITVKMYPCSGGTGSSAIIRFGL